MKLLLSSPVETDMVPRQNKKTDVVEHPEAFGHVGLLFNKPPGTSGWPFN